MRPALLLLALWPAAVPAQDATRHAWGVPVEGSGPSVVSVAPCEAPCAAVVRFDNTLVTLGPGETRVEQATLAMDGVTLAVTVLHGGGQAPDLLRVAPPSGYVAEPAEVLVEDEAEGEVRVVLAPMS